MIKRSVLFVDDEPEVLSSINRLFIDEPYDVLLSECGDDTLNILRSEDIHVVVVDLRMPKMDGLSLLKEIERFHPNIIRLVLSVAADSESNPPEKSKTFPLMAVVIPSNSSGVPFARTNSSRHASWLKTYRAC